MSAPLLVIRPARLDPCAEARVVGQLGTGTKREKGLGYVVDAHGRLAFE